MLGLHVQLIVRLLVRPADLAGKIDAWPLRRRAFTSTCAASGEPVARPSTVAGLEPREQRPRLEAQAAEQARRLHVAQLGREIERAGRQIELARNPGFGLGDIAHGQLADLQAPVHRRASRAARSCR